MNNIDLEKLWKDAPEWATEYGDIGLGELNVFANNVKYQYYRGGTGEIHNFSTDGQGSFQAGDFKMSLQRPAEPLIYTQAMVDAGEQVKVGMECMIVISTSAYKGTITYMGKNLGCYHSKDNDMEYSFGLSTVKFKPLDTRSDKQKAFDDIQSFMEDHSSAPHVIDGDFTKEIFNAVKRGDWHSITFSGKD